MLSVDIHQFHFKLTCLLFIWNEDKRFILTVCQWISIYNLLSCILAVCLSFKCTCISIILTVLHIVAGSLHRAAEQGRYNNLLAVTSQVSKWIACIYNYIYIDIYSNNERALQNSHQWIRAGIQVVTNTCERLTSAVWVTHDQYRTSYGAVGMIFIRDNNV